MTARARLALATLALLAFVTFVYAPVLQGAFVWDDHALVQENPLVARGSLRAIFHEPYWTATPLSDLRPVYYRPISMLSLRADYAIAGDDPGSFHLTNLLLHLLATLCVVLAARRLGASGWGAVIAGAVWALHPRSTECVAWIAGRTDVLACAFGLAALTLWPWYGHEARVPRGATPRAALAALAFLLALLSKEVAIAVAAALVVGTLSGAGSCASPTDPGVARGRALARLGWLAAALGVYGALRWGATHDDAAALPPASARANVLTVLEAIGRYAVMIVDGWHPTTSIGLVGEPAWPMVALGAVTSMVAGALAVRAVVRRRRASATTTASEAAPSPPSGAVATLVALGVGALVLVVHLFPILLAGGVAADRLLYLPLAALAIGLAIAATKLPPRMRKAAGVAALLLAASYAPFTRARTYDYSDELRFRLVASEHAHPHNTTAKSGLANALRANAELDLACRLHAAVQRSLASLPERNNARYIRALENLGSCYAVIGDYAQADIAFAELLSLRPNSGRVHMDIGFVALHRQAIDDAERSLGLAVHLEPGLTAARRALDSLPAIRQGVVRFTTEDARASDRVGWARLATALGRVPDANAAWLAVAVDPASSDRAAMNGFEFVLANSTPAAARSAADAIFAREAFYYRTNAALQLRQRLAIQARIDLLRPRIEALLDEPRASQQRP